MALLEQHMPEHEAVGGWKLPNAIFTCCERRVFIFVCISLDGAVIPLISFYRVPVFSRGTYQRALSLLSLSISF